MMVKITNSDEVHIQPMLTIPLCEIRGNLDSSATLCRTPAQFLHHPGAPRNLVSLELAWGLSTAGLWALRGPLWVRYKSTLKSVSDVDLCTSIIEYGFPFIFFE